MPNLAGLTANTTKALSLSNIILVTPETPNSYQPQNPTGTSEVPKLIFNYEGEQSGSFESDITDHYVETNIAYQDQIALKPEEITVQGFIGELNDIVPGLLGDFTPKFIADKLTTLDAFAPGLSATASQSYGRALQGYQTAQRFGDAAVSAWGTISGSRAPGTIGSGGLSGFDAATGRIQGIQNKQQIAFQQFYGYWRARYLFTVQTPWAVFENMAIKSLRPTQDAETNKITAFEITFKMIRKTQTLLGGEDISQLLQGRAGAQGSRLINQGTSPGGEEASFGANLGELVA